MLNTNQGRSRDRPRKTKCHLRSSDKDATSYVTRKSPSVQMALYQSSDGSSFRGPVAYGQDSLTIEPVVRWIGSAKTLGVTSWPAGAVGTPGVEGLEPSYATPLIVEGLEFQKAS